jgi:hypothetical protein
MRWGGRFISDADVGADFIPNGKRAATRRPGKLQTLLEGAAAK